MKNYSPCYKKGEADIAVVSANHVIQNNTSAAARR